MATRYKVYPPSFYSRMYKIGKGDERMEWWKRTRPAWRLAGVVLALLLLSRLAVYGAGYLGMNLFPSYAQEP